MNEFGAVDFMFFSFLGPSGDICANTRQPIYGLLTLTQSGRSLFVCIFYEDSFFPLSLANFIHNLWLYIFWCIPLTKRKAQSCGQKIIQLGSFCFECNNIFFLSWQLNYIFIRFYYYLCCRWMLQWKSLLSKVIKSANNSDWMGAPRYNAECLLSIFSPSKFSK